MTNPNWWDVEPFCDTKNFEYDSYNIPLIIAEVEKRGETTVEDCGRYNECCACFGQFHDDDVNFCPHCGSKIAWYK